MLIYEYVIAFVMHIPLYGIGNNSTSFDDVELFPKIFRKIVKVVVDLR